MLIPIWGSRLGTLLPGGKRRWKAWRMLVKNKNSSILAKLSPRQLRGPATWINNVILCHYRNHGYVTSYYANTGIMDTQYHYANTGIIDTQYQIMPLSV